MNKTEAGKAIGRQVAQSVVHNGKELSSLLVQEIISDCQGGYRGGYLQEAAQTTTYRTVLRYAREALHDYGRDDLIGR